MNRLNKFLLFVTTHFGRGNGNSLLSTNIRLSLNMQKFVSYLKCTSKPFHTKKYKKKNIAPTSTEGWFNVTKIKYDFFNSNSI